MLTDKQKLTLEHLKVGKTYPEIIEWCKLKMTLPRIHSRPNAKSLVGRRKYGKAYYQAILDFVTKGIYV